MYNNWHASCLEVISHKCCCFRLEVDIEDTSDDSSSDSESHQPKLHLHETIAKEILSQDSILPKKILQDM